MRGALPAAPRVSDRRSTTLFADRAGPAADLLAGDPAGLRAVAELVALGTGAVAEGARGAGPTPAGDPATLDAAVGDALGAVLPEHGMGTLAALAPLAGAYAAGSVRLAHPASVAHLQAPPLAVAVAADTVAAALNQSVDTWDSGPFAVELERRVVATLADVAGLPSSADGVFTPGGSVSNLMALLLARDAGRGGGPGRPRVVCSDQAHYSLARAAGVLGWGEEAVLAVPTGRDGRLTAAAVHRALRPDDTPAVVVATAGTTDLGAVDALPELAAFAAARGAWFHVDAAYGGGALFSDRLAGLLTGVQHADSVTLDLHKLGWQPAAASVLLVRDAGRFAPLARQVPYLNPADDEAAGYSSLLGRSLQTTRRADAFRVAVTLRALGRRGLGALVDRCHDLARHAAARIAAEPRLDLAAPVTLTTVVFRCRVGGGPAGDRLHAAVRRRLLRDGTAVLGRATLPDPAGVPRVHLKLTLLNPHTTAAALDGVLDAVLATADALGAIRAPSGAAVAGLPTR